MRVGLGGGSLHRHRRGLATVGRPTAPAPPPAPAEAAAAPPARPERTEPSGGDWAAFALTLAGLTAAAWLARRRSRSGDEAPPSRLLRILHCAGALALWMTAALAAEEMVRAGWSAEVPLMAAVALGVFTAIGLVLFAILDFWLGLFRPRQSRGWAAAAVAAFVLLVAGCFVAAARLAGETAQWLALDLATVAAGGSAIGLVWWAFLPAPDAKVGAVFG